MESCVLSQVFMGSPTDVGFHGVNNQPRHTYLSADWDVLRSIAPIDRASEKGPLAAAKFSSAWPFS